MSMGTAPADDAPDRLGSPTIIAELVERYDEPDLLSLFPANVPAQVRNARQIVAEEGSFVGLDEVR